MRTGRYNLAQLLDNPEIEQIIIPELQRDYVWKNINVRRFLDSIKDNYTRMTELSLDIKSPDKFLDGSIESILREEYRRLRFNTRVGFIYAYHDISLPGQYYLIDGQQRITTLYLLALYRQFDADLFRKKYFRNGSLKVDYKIREAAHSFMTGFTDFELTKKDAGEKFRDSPDYYRDYAKDVTVQSVYSNYYDVIVPAIQNINAEDFADYVEHYVEFNYFDTSRSEQGERLYIYMNSRGETLTDQELIKSVIVSRSEHKLAAGELWEKWQNFFWINRGENRNADRGFLVFIKWSVVLQMNTPGLNCNIKSGTVPPGGKHKTSTEEKEDYIRIETDIEKQTQQNEWIYSYVRENEIFDIAWLETVMQSVERLNCIKDKFDYAFVPGKWLTGPEDTIDYVQILGVLQYMIVFPDSDDRNVFRIGMFLKNLRSEYYNRRNPDNAVIRVLGFVHWLAGLGIEDIRMLYNRLPCQKFEYENIFSDDDLRFQYYANDLESGITDDFGRWESFFWKITDQDDLNVFFRGNHNFIVRLFECGSLPSPEEYLYEFCEKIFKHRYEDGLRSALLQYGDISVDDKGGSGNLGIWMRRYCVLGKVREDIYWNTFLTDPSMEAVRIIDDYITDKLVDASGFQSVLKLLSANVGYMEQKYYLKYEYPGEMPRIVLLREKQAASYLSRELPVQMLHRSIRDSWVWEYKTCVVNFVVRNNTVETIKEHDKGYYFDIVYDWNKNGGVWNCKFGHKEDNLPEKVISFIMHQNTDISDSNSVWRESIQDNGLKVICKTIYKEDLTITDFTKRVEKVKSWFESLWETIGNNCEIFRLHQKDE